MTRLLLAALLAGLALPVLAQSPTDLAVQAMQTCAEGQPDNRKVAQALSDSGWRYEGTFENVRIYARDGYRAVVGLPVSFDPRNVCVVYVSRLTQPGAGKLARAVASSFGRYEEVGEIPGVGAGSAYAFGVRGRIMVVAPVEYRNFRIMRGAGIALAAPELE